MKNLIYGAALLMSMAVSASTFAAPKSFNGERSKTELRYNDERMGGPKKCGGQHCNHHHNCNHSKWHGR